MKKTDSECNKKEKLEEQNSPDLKVETEAVAENVNAEEPSAEDAIKQLEDKVKDLELEVADRKNQLLMAHADLDNTRKRLIKEKEDAIKYANSKLIEELLIPMDNLKRALDSFKQGGDASAVADGVEMVSQQLMDILKHNGLEKIVSDPGTEFNPDEHEACMMNVSSDVKVETVTAEFISGYKLHGRVIRPAKVQVSKPEV